MSVFKDILIAAFDAGTEAYFNGVLRNKPPYEDQIKSDYWQQGWDYGLEYSEMNSKRDSAALDQEADYHQHLQSMDNAYA